MTDIALFCVATYRAGEAGYLAPRPRGHLDVRYDSKRWLYDLRGLHVTAGEARRFVETAFDRFEGVDVVGRYPVYEVLAR